MLQATALCKRYKGKPALDGVSFTLAPGQCLGIAGHNGSGKSTLLSIVGQVLPPDGGDILADGKSVLGNRAFMRQSLGYVPQQDGLLEDLTVLQTLRFWQKAYGVDGPLFAAGAPAALLGLQPLAKKRVKALSGGMKKRLSIAVALLHSPQYLLLDEVLPALDRRYRTILYNWMAEFLNGGGAILYCGHELLELQAFCTGLLVLRQGKAVYHGPPEGLPDDPPTLDRLLNPLPEDDA